MADTSTLTAFPFPTPPNLSTDPDGLRLELNHVPGRGLFDTPTQRVGGAFGPDA